MNGKSGFNETISFDKFSFRFSFSFLASSLNKQLFQAYPNRSHSNGSTHLSQLQDNKGEEEGAAFFL